MAGLAGISPKPAEPEPRFPEIRGSGFFVTESYHTQPQRCTFLMHLERAVGFLIGTHFGTGIVHRASIPDIDLDADTGTGVFHRVGAKRDTQFVNRGGPF